MALCLLIAAVYGATGVAGLSLATWGGQVTLLWAPTGISLGALVIGGRGLWPGVWLGALVVNLWVGDPLVALAISVGNTLEAVVGATLLDRAGFQRGLARLEDVGSFLAYGVVGAPVVAATVGTAALLAAGASLADAPLVWLIWWVGDSTGALLVAPALLTWSASRPRREELVPGAVLAAIVLAAGYGAFFTEGHHTLPLALVPFPVVFAAALRLGLPVATALLALASVVAVTGSLLHAVPLDAPEIWAYLLVLGSSTLVAAALVAERRAAQDRQREVEAAALETQHLESLGVLAGGVAHDFNNLLQIILGHTSMLREEIPVAPREHLDRIDDAVGRASRLVRQLLDYAGNAPTQAEALDLETELVAIADLARVAVSPTVDLSLDLGGGAAVVCDRGQLHQVVLNLLTNAAEVVPPSGHVTLRCGEALLDAPALAAAAVVGAGARPGPFGWIEVVDDGPGIDPEIRDRMFEPFVTTKFFGRGLGLASVAGVVRAHAGAIEVDSRAGAGTRIRVWLPAPEHPVEPPC